MQVLYKIFFLKKIKLLFKNDNKNTQIVNLSIKFNDLCKYFQKKPPFVYKYNHHSKNSYF